MPGQNELELSEITQSKDPEIVKGWNDNPLLLVNQLRVALNQVTSCLEPDETDVNRRAKLKDGVNWQTRAVLLCGVYPLQLARQIKLLKTLHETLPFDESILREVSEATQPFDSPRFVEAITKWRAEFSQLADWAALQRRIRPQGDVRLQIVHGVTLEIIQELRAFLVARNGNHRTGKWIIDNFKGNDQVKNLALRVLQRLGEFKGKYRNPTPKVAQNVEAIISGLNLKAP